MLGLHRPIGDRRRSSRSFGGLWQGCCGRWHAMANCREISSLGWRTGSARASLCSSATSAILIQPVAILSAECYARWSRLQLVSLSDGVQTGQQ